MAIIIFTDRPLKMKTSIGELKKRGLHVEVLYFSSNDYEYAMSIHRVRYHLGKLGFHLKRLKSWECNSVIDALYQDEYNLFLFDVDLSGNVSTDFENRIGIKYALKRKDGNGKPSERIWFYTTGREDIHEKLDTYFPFRTIEVLTTEENWQVVLDFDMVEDVLAEYGEKCKPEMDSCIIKCDTF